MSKNEVIKWMSIEQLQNTIHNVQKLYAQENLPVVKYFAKIKLHGCNGGIQITPDGPIAQSRSQTLVDGRDHYGFARWVESNRSYFELLDSGITVFGEWAGPGIQKGVAISNIPNKIFTVFAIARGDELIWDPSAIARMLYSDIPFPKDMYILPVCNQFTIDFSSPTALEAVVNEINAYVSEVEKEDPWVKKHFGVSGIGEGIVCYPDIDDFIDTYQQFIFKAKGQEHRLVGPAPAYVYPVGVITPEEFATQTVSENRLKQGLFEVCADVVDKKKTGDFVNWVFLDIQKECKLELEASGLEWSQVRSAVQAKARSWYFAQ
jgi:hypothetical protein